MSIKRRLTNLERKFGDNDLPELLILVTFTDNQTDKKIIEQHCEQAKKYVDEHPEVWVAVNEKSKALLVFVSTTGWKIDHLPKAEEPSH